MEPALLRFDRLQGGLKVGAQCNSGVKIPGLISMTFRTADTTDSTKHGVPFASQTEPPPRVSGEVRRLIKEVQPFTVSKLDALFRFPVGAGLYISASVSSEVDG